MIVTAQMLRDLGAKNVASLPTMCSIINNGVATAHTLRYNSLEEVKLANWFHDSSIGLTIITENAEGVPDDGGYYVRLFDFGSWKQDFQEDMFSLLTIHRMKQSGELKPIMKTGFGIKVEIFE